MAINNRWLVQKFDYVAQKLMWQSNPITGLQEPVYWDETEVSAFVDSDLGNDLTGDGSAALPWKTISKVKSAGATYWGANKVIMCRGFFIEPIQINSAIKIVGAGGLFGTAVISGAFSIIAGSNNCVLENIMVINNAGQPFVNITTSTQTVYAYNTRIFNTTFTESANSHLNAYFYMSILYNINYNGSAFSLFFNFSLRGNNNTLYIKTGSIYYFYVYGNNNHIYGYTGNNYGSNNLFGITGDYLDISNYNFNFLNTSPLYHTGTYNPDTDNYNHVGAGTEGISLNALSDSMNDEVDAVYNNLSKSGTEIYRTDIALDGILESGIIDFGTVKTRVIMNMNYTYEISDGVIYRRVQETSGLTITQIFDCIIQYGETLSDLSTCPDLLIEYGKLITVSGTGLNRVGNADPLFDTANIIAIDSLLIRYIKFKLRLKNI